MLLNGSAIGYYGTSTTASFTEASPAGADVLGRLCQAWEEETQTATGRCRLVILRIGIVLGVMAAPSARCCPCFAWALVGPLAMASSG